MGDLSTHFSREEFACQCGCGFDTVDSMLLSVLEDIRGHFDSPVTINSGCRCLDHNKAVGSKSNNSQHVKGRAADIVVGGTSPEDVQMYLLFRYPDMFGIGEYSTFTHIDTRSDGPARWEG